MAKTGKTQAIDVRQFKGLNTIDDPIALDPGDSPYMLNMDITRNGAMQARFGYETFSTIPGATGPMRGLLKYYRMYDDNNSIDNSSSGGANTYTTPVAISETATNRKTFTPSSAAKSKVARIGVWVVSAGTGAWTLYLHDASNNLLSARTIQNASLLPGQLNYFDVPYTWTSGALHFHITSSVADGTAKVVTAGNLETVNYSQTYSTVGDYLILFHSNGNAYYVTNSNKTPTLIGSYGTDNGIVRGLTFNNLSIFGNGYVQNDVKKWDGTALSSLATGAPPANVLGTLNNVLFLNSTQSGTTIKYCDRILAGDTIVFSPTNVVTVNTGDGQNVTALIHNNDFLQVFKEDSIYGINFSYDANYNPTMPQLQQIVSSQGGCYAPGSAQAVYGYTYYLSKKAFEAYGPSERKLVADQTAGLSFKIDPTVQNINFAYRDLVNSIFHENKYICQVPMAQSTLPDYTLVYNENVKRRFQYDNWTVYTGIPAVAWATFRDANRRDRLYFASHTDPKVYLSNTSFSDDGNGYDRLWRSKTFQFGERTRWKWIDIEGSMVANSTIYVDFNVDGTLVSGTVANTQKITEANILLSTAGDGYIGDNYIGDSYVGAAFSTGAPEMFKFKKRIHLPPEANYGYNMWFQLRNQTAGEGWKLSRFKLVYESESDLPTYEKSNQ